MGLGGCTSPLDLRTKERDITGFRWFEESNQIKRALVFNLYLQKEIKELKEELENITR